MKIPEDGYLTDEQVARIRERITTLGYARIEDFGDEINMDKSQLARLFNARQVARLDTLQRIANGLDWTLAQLLNTSADAGPEELARTPEEFDAWFHEVAKRAGKHVRNLSLAASGDLDREELERDVLASVGKALLQKREEAAARGQSKARRALAEGSPSRERRKGAPESS